MIISSIKSDYNKFFFKILIFIFIFSLVSGPFVPDLIVSISSLFFIYFMIKQKLFRDILNNKLTLFLILFYIYIVFNSLFSHNILVSLKSAVPFCRLIFFALLVSYIFQNREYKNFTLYTFIILYSLLFADVIFQTIYGFNILGYELSINRASSVFGDELILGSFVSRTYGIFLFLLFNISPKNKIILFFYVTTICLIMVILSGERTALAIFIMIMFFAFFYLSNKYKLFIILILGISFLSGLIINKNSYERIINHTLNQLTENSSLNFFSFRHQLHFLTAFEIFKDNLLLGAGIKSFRYLCSNDQYEKKIHEFIESKDNFAFYAKTDGYIENLKIPSKDDFNKSYYRQLVKKGEKFLKGDKLYFFYEYKNGCNTHPHNFFMQFLSELGIVGILFFIILYYKILKYLIKRLFSHQIEDSNYFILAIFFSKLFPLFPSGNFFNNYLSILTFLPLGLINLWKLKN